MTVPARPTLNDLFLRRGRFPDAGGTDEVLVSEAFALARTLEPGDRVGAVINGRRRELEIVGRRALAGVRFRHQAGRTDPRRLALRRVLDGRTRRSPRRSTWKAGSTASSATLLPGASEADVIAQARSPAGDSTAASGPSRARCRCRTSYLDNELAQMQSVGLVVPIVFLPVAAFLLNVVLTRIVSVQREQIAALKALGYTNGELAWHYTKLSLLIGAAGGTVGVGAGAWMGSGMTGIYNGFFRFPMPY